MHRYLKAILVVCSLAATMLAQSTQPSAADKKAETEKAAVELLRETLSEIGQLRTAENRISFTSELASLMWFHDPKEAKVMYGTVITDFKQLLMQLDADSNAPLVPDDDVMGPSLFGPNASKGERKLRVAVAVRQAVAMSIAEHDADLAFTFFYDTKNLISNPKLASIAGQGDKYFEEQLTQQIAKSDPAKAAEYGKQSLKAGVTSTHVELLKTIYAKDADKGIEYGQAVLDRSKSDPVNTYAMESLLSFGDKTLSESEKTRQKKAVYTRDELRQIAEVLAKRILDSEDEESGYGANESVDEIAKFAPGRAIQIRAKMAAREQTASPRFRRGANVFANVSTRSGAANANSANSNRFSPELDAAEERAKKQKELMDNVQALGTKELPKEERDKFVDRTRKLIMSSAGRENKITALSMLASQVAKLGDKELAGDIMADAERLLPIQPKNYQDFMLEWIVISGYAEVDPDKAFPLLNGAIVRVNETLAALMKIGEFIDVNEDFIEDGEAQIGAFGGSMVRGFTSELALVGTTATIRTLALADLKKTTAAANTFERPEARVLAKMLILRAVLDKTPQTPQPLGALDSGMPKASGQTRPQQPTPTVDDERNAVHKACSIRGEIEGGVFDVLDLAKTAQRDLSHDLFFQLRDQKPLHALGVLDRSRSDSVDANAVTAPFNGQIASDRVHACLGRRDMDLHRRRQVM